MGTTQLLARDHVSDGFIGAGFGRIFMVLRQDLEEGVGHLRG